MLFSLVLFFLVTETKPIKGVRIIFSFAQALLFGLNNAFCCWVDVGLEGVLDFGGFLQLSAFSFVFIEIKAL